MKNLSGLLVIGMLCFVSNFVSAQSQTYDAVLVEDAYLQGSSGYNQNLIRIQQNYRRGFLKFNAGTIDGTITGVQLLLTIDSDSGDGTITVTKGAHSNWSESSLTSATAPAASTSLTTRSSSGSGTHTYDLDVTDTSIYSGIFTLRLDHTGSNDLAYASSENTNTSIRPKLIITYTPTPVDSTAPSTPTLSSSNEMDTSVVLNWTEATDNIGVTGYKLFRGTALEYEGSSRTKTVAGLTPGQTYNFSVVAYDAVGNTSSAGSKQVTTIQTTALAPPTNLSVTVPNNNSSTLSWTASTSSNVSGYKVYKNGSLLTTVGNVTSHTVNNLSTSAIETFFLKSIDGNGNESADSNQVTVDNTSSGGGDPGTGNGNWTLSGDNAYRLTGNIGIGTANSVPTNGNPNYRLAVNGSIRAKEIKVETGWADYVFFKDYKLPTLQEVEQHIQEKGHLIDIPSAAEVEANGIELGEMNKLLLEKIEELTLYTIQQQKEIEDLRQLVKAQK